MTEFDQAEFSLLPQEDIIGVQGMIHTVPPGRFIYPDSERSFFRFHETEKELAALPRDQQFKLLARGVGNTPTYKIDELGEELPIFQKFEFFNPSGSHYDRVYLPTIQSLEEAGLIEPGDELRDITSGSAGISLSMFGRLLGYPVRITVPDELPEARIWPMRIMDAGVVRCGSGYIKAASEFQRTEIITLLQDGWSRTRSADPDMRAIVLEKASKRICYINHSENYLSTQSFEGIGEEFVQRWESNRPFYVTLAMGNWTSIAGISRVLGKWWPNTVIVGYEGENRQNHDNYGTTVDEIPLRFKDEGLLFEKRVVTNAQRDAMDERINQSPSSRFHKRKSHQIGHSSLMGLVVAEQLAKEEQAFGSDRPVFCIAYDQKYRY